MKVTYISIICLYSIHYHYYWRKGYQGLKMHQMRQNVSNFISSSSFFQQFFLGFATMGWINSWEFWSISCSRIRTKNNLNVFVAHTHHLNLSWKIAPLQVNRKQIALLDLQSIWLKRAVGYNTETIILGNNIFHHLKHTTPYQTTKAKGTLFRHKWTQ